jgi:hypothetical protein
MKDGGAVGDIVSKTLIIFQKLADNITDTIIHAVHCHGCKYEVNVIPYSTMQASAVISHFSLLASLMETSIEHTRSVA